MNEQALKDALDAILEIAEGIRDGDLPDDLADQIDLIVAIARANIKKPETDGTDSIEHHIADGTGFPMPE